MPCPAGRYGNSTGLTNATCDGPCALGYFCDVLGSTVATAKPCPAGSFGNVTGLKDEACSGLCYVGYWCGAVRARQLALLRRLYDE